jgi:hypothetical protein
MVQAIPRYALIGRLGVTIDMYPPDERKRDCDNFCKAVFDALQKFSVIRDDADFDEIHLMRRELCKGGKLNLVIWELQERPCVISGTPISSTSARASRSAHLDSLARLEAPPQFWR